MKRSPAARRSWVIIPAVVILSVLASLALKPVPNPQDAEIIQVEGRIESVTSPCCNDVQIRLADDPRAYHINRGLEAGLVVEHLRQHLEGQTVQMRVVKRTWSPIDPLHRMMPVAELGRSGEIFFSAFE
jgi:hypothetical protein